MQQLKLPKINEKFDLKLFRHIFFKTLWIFILIFILSGISAFVVLRYTSSIYSSKAILQISNANRAQKILEISDIYNEYNDLAPVMELIRSKEFLKRALKNLPLDVGYYRKGTFLTEDLYPVSFYNIDYKIAEANHIYNTPVSIQFNENYTYNLEINEKQYNKNYSFGKWHEILPGFELELNIIEPLGLDAHLASIKKNNEYFVIKRIENIYNENVKKLSIKVENPSAQTISISFTDKNARRSTEIVNTIAEEFLHYDLEKKKESASKILEFIDKQSGIVKGELNTTERQLHKFKKDKKITLTELNASPFPIYTTKINEIEHEILKIEFEIVNLNLILDKITSSKEFNIYELISLLSGTRSENIVVNILNDLQSIINEKNQLLNDVTANNFQIKAIEKQLQDKKQSLIDFLQSALDRMKKTKSNYESKIKVLEDELISKTGVNEIELARLERLYEINEEFYNKLLEKKAEYLIFQAGYVTKNVILENATVPSAPIFPVKSKILIIFFVIGFVLCLWILVLRYLFYNEITNSDDIKNYIDIPILGLIPNYAGDVKKSQLIINQRPKSHFAESFRVIRSNLQFLSAAEESKVITISSTISGEGKTLIAINLAAIIAFTGKKVVLIDTDLRKPYIHRSFKVRNNKGISSVLINKHSIQESTHKTEIEGLDFIPAGPLPPNPSELIISKAMEDLVNSLKKKYDFIILDTSPLGLVTDALTSYKRSDYPIYIIKANYSKRNFLYNVEYLVNVMNIKNLSIILNGFDFSVKTDYGYGYGYGYGKEYGNTHDYYLSDEPLKKKTFLQKILTRIFGVFNRTK